MNKNTRNLLIVFVILITVVYLFFGRKERISTQNIPEKLFTADSSKIDKIEMIKNSESITVEKVNGNWMVTKPVNYPADTSAITPMLSNLKNFKIESEVSSNPQKFPEFLDSANNATVNVYQEGKQIGTFKLGKGTTATDNSYILKSDGSGILLASKLTAFNFTKPLKDYRSKSIFSIQSFMINKIVFKSDDSLKYELNAVKDTAGVWYLGTDSIPRTNMEGFLNLMAAFTTEDFKDSTMTTFPPPVYTINIYGNQNAAINFYKENTSPVKYIVQVTNNKQLFEFTEGFAKNFMKQKKDLIPEKQPEKKEEPKKEEPKKEDKKKETTKKKK